MVEIAGGRIHPRADDKGRRTTDRNAVVVTALVQSAQHFDQPERIDLPHARGIGIVAVQRRRARAAQDVANAKGIRPEQVRLEHHQAFFPGGRRQDDVEPRHTLLHQQRQTGRTDVGARTANWSDDHRVAARRLQQRRVRHRSVGFGAGGWR